MRFWKLGFVVAVCLMAHTAGCFGMKSGRTRSGQQVYVNKYGREYTSTGGAVSTDRYGTKHATQESSAFNTTKIAEPTKKRAAPAAIGFVRSEIVEEPGEDTRFVKQRIVDRTIYVNRTLDKEKRDLFEGKKLGGLSFVANKIGALFGSKDAKDKIASHNIAKASERLAVDPWDSEANRKKDRHQEKIVPIENMKKK